MATNDYHFIIRLLFYSFSEDDVCTGIEMFEELFLSVRSDGGCEWLSQRLLKWMTLHGEDLNTQHTVSLYLIPTYTAPSSHLTC